MGKNYQTRGSFEAVGGDPTQYPLRLILTISQWRPKSKKSSMAFPKFYRKQWSKRESHSAS